MTGAFPHLLAPGRIGTLELRNRIVHAPMSLGLGQGDGTCGERFVAYYARRAQGGAGLINIGTVSVGYPEGSVDAKQIAASDDRFIPSLAGLAEAVHAHGAKIVLQLNHNGPQAGGDRAAGRPLAVPSVPIARRGDLVDCFLPEELAALAAGNPVAGEITYNELDEAGIARIVAMFAAAAERAKRAGIDAVEIHGGHGYLLAAFLSPVTNRRTDAYGGTVENRSRFLVEVIRAVRAAVGPDFPVWCKLDSEEFELEGGIRVEDAIVTARLAEVAGADAISVSAYSDVSKAVTHSGSHTPQQPELLVPNATRIKHAVGIPVITAGRIEVAAADRHIAAGDFDFVAFGRKLLTDPDLPNKLVAGRPDAVRPCIYCYSCISQAYFRRPILCAINPDMGREIDHRGAPSPRPQRVVVVGGGPVGMEATLRLAAEGHQAILFERSARLGGSFHAAGQLYGPNQDYLDWLEREIGASPVDVRLNSEATAESIAALRPDLVIVTASRLAAHPPYSGIDLPHVTDIPTFLSTYPSPFAGRGGLSAGRDDGATDESETPDGDRDMRPFAGQSHVILGGGTVALEMAQWLRGHGAEVSVVDMAPKLGAGLPIVRRARLLTELREDGVSLNPGARDIVVGTDVVRWIDPSGEARQARAESVILAAAPVPDTKTPERLAAAGYRVLTAGDGAGLHNLEESVRAVWDLVDSI